MAINAKGKDTAPKAAPQTVSEGVNAELEPASVAASQNLIGEPAPGEKPENLLDVTLEAQVTQLGRKTAEMLRKGPKTEAYINPDPLNKADNIVQVGINGWNFTIEKGKWVLLPNPVIILLQNGGYPVTTRMMH